MGIITLSPKGLAWFLRGAYRRISKNHDKRFTAKNVFGWNKKLRIMKKKSVKSVSKTVRY